MYDSIKGGIVHNEYMVAILLYCYKSAFVMQDLVLLISLHLSTSSTTYEH